MGSFDAGDVSLDFFIHTVEDDVVAAWVDHSIVVVEVTIVGDVPLESKEEPWSHIDVACLVKGSSLAGFLDCFDHCLL